MTSNEYNSRIIDLMRPFMLLLVIFNHCFGVVGGGNFLVYNIVQVFLGKTVTLAAVNVFFLISGFLFFYNVTKIDDHIIWSKIRKRFRTLVIPYLLWNILGICVVWGVGIALGWDISSNGDISIKHFFSYLWCSTWWDVGHTNILGWGTEMAGPVDIPLWYLRDLIVVTLFSPVLFLTIKSFGKWSIYILGVLYVFNIWLQIPGFSVRAFFFWTVGAYLSLNKLSITVCIKNKYCKIAIIVLTSVMTILVTWLIYRNEHFIITDILHQIVTMGLILFFFMVFDKLVKHEKKMVIPPLILSSVFFVFAFHDFPVINPIVVVSKLLSFLPDIELITIVKYLITPFIVYALSVCVYFMSKHFCPRITMLFTGNR